MTTAKTSKVTNSLSPSFAVVDREFDVLEGMMGISNQQVDKYLAVSGYDNFKIAYEKGELKLHRYGSQFVIEYWEKDERVKDLDTYFDRIEAIGRMVELVSEKRKS